MTGGEDLNPFFAREEIWGGKKIYKPSFAYY
jgi:hypothetical protein